MMSTTISVIPSSFPLEDAKILQQLLPSKFSLGEYTTIPHDVTWNSLTQIKHEKSNANNDNRISSAIKTNSSPVLVNIYEISNGRKLSDRPCLIFVNFVEKTLSSNYSQNSDVNVPSVTLLIERDEMEQLVSDTPNIPSIVLEKYSSTVICMKLKGGSTLLFISQTDVSSAITHLLLSSGKRQGYQSTEMNRIHETENINSNGRNNQQNPTTKSISGYASETTPCKDPDLSDFKSMTMEALTPTKNKYEIEDAKTEKSSSLKLSKPPDFTTLSVKSMDGKSIQINSREGVPIENEFFEGRIMLILRPPNPTDDPYYYQKLFSKKKRVVSHKYFISIVKTFS